MLAQIVSYISPFFKNFIKKDIREQLKNLNVRYGEDIKSCDIFKNAYETEVKDNTIVIKLKKKVNQTWYDYFLSIRNENGELTMDCKIAVTIIRNLYEEYTSNEMTIKLLTTEELESSDLNSNFEETDLKPMASNLYKYKSGEFYLSHTLHNYILCTYNNFHPGIWLYMDPSSNNYIGLSFEGIKSKPLEYWQKFLLNDELKNYTNLCDDTVTYLCKFYKKDKIYVYATPRSMVLQYMILEDSITIFIKDISIKFEVPDIGKNLLKYIDESSPGVGVNINWEENGHDFMLTDMNIKIELGNLYYAFALSMIFNYSSLKELYKFYPTIENM